MPHVGWFCRSYVGFLHELPVWVEHKMHWEMPALSALHPKTGSPKLPHQTGEGLIFLLCLQFLIFFSLVCSSLPNIFFFFFVGLAVLQHSLSQLGQQGRICPIYVFLKMKKGCWWVGLGRDGGCLCLPKNPQLLQTGTSSFGAEVPRGNWKATSPEFSLEQNWEWF